MYKFDLNVNTIGGSIASTASPVWQVGTNFSDATTNAAEPNPYATFGVDFNTATTWRITGTAPTFAPGTTQTITWVMNNKVLNQLSKSS
jgi:hypothetical protein